MSFPRVRLRTWLLLVAALAAAWGCLFALDGQEGLPPERVARSRGVMIAAGIALVLPAAALAVARESYRRKARFHADAERSCYERWQAGRGDETAATGDPDDEARACLERARWHASRRRAYDLGVRFPWIPVPPDREADAPGSSSLPLLVLVLMMLAGILMLVLVMGE